MDVLKKEIEDLEAREYPKYRENSIRKEGFFHDIIFTDMFGGFAAIADNTEMTKEMQDKVLKILQAHFRK